MTFYTVQEQGDTGWNQKAIELITGMSLFQKTLLAGTLMKNGEFSELPI